MIRGSFSFARIAPALSILYLAVLSVILLYPFHFRATPTENDNSVAWLNDADGVRFGQSGMLVSAFPPASLYQQMISGAGLTIELWLSTASSDQKGPARIISYSINPWERNFTLGQEGNDLNMRLRTTGTGPNGTPSVDVADALVPGKTQYVVVTYDLVEERIYVDGKLKVTSTIPRGNFDTWDPSFYLVFGNERSGGRPWDGTIAYAAIYNRPLSERIVEARFSDGYPPVASPDGLLAAFDFAHRLNARDGSKTAVGLAAPLPPLTKPARVGASRLFLSFINGRLVFAESTPWDLIRNVILFVPLGVFVFAAFRKRGRSAASAILLTLIGAGLASALFEVLQYFLDARTSSIFDIGTNVAGALVGAAGCWYWLRRLEISR